MINSVRTTDFQVNQQPLGKQCLLNMTLYLPRQIHSSYNFGGTTELRRYNSSQSSVLQWVPNNLQTHIYLYMHLAYT